MSRAEHSVEIPELLAHADWVRAVAGRLVGNASVAEDVAQDAWVAALKQPPRLGDNLRAWFAKLVTNQARQRGRGESRRRHRERAATSPEARHSTDEIAERAELQRELVGHVLALEEPFRSVVLLRFFEDLSAPEIASRLDVPLKTVHSRMQRAFDRLRVKLDREYGDRRSWSLALVPIAATRDAIPPAALSSTLSTVGVLLVNVNLRVGIVLLLAVVGGIGLWTASPGESEAVRTSAVDLQSSGGESQALGKPEKQGPTPASTEREVIPIALESDETQAPVDEVPGWLVRGRVVDMSGTGLKGLEVGLAGRSTEALAITGVDGAFEARVTESPFALFDARLGESCLLVRDDDWVTVRQSCVADRNHDLEHIVVVAPLSRSEGWVQDSEGAPIAEARISTSSLGDEFFGFPFALDLTSFVPVRTSSDAAGKFVFERFPRAEGIHLHASADGYQLRTIELDGAEWPLVIRLARAEETGVFLDGVVLNSNGFVVEGARIQLAEATAKSDATGQFRIAIDQVGAATPLCAAKDGSLPALIPNFGQLIERQGGKPAPVEMVLGAPPLEIHGRVVDESGAPCVGWIVSVADETEISQYRIPVDTAEALARGRSKTVVTKQDGSFRIRGLYPREYRIQAYEKKTLLRCEGSFTAGDPDAVLRASRELRADVHGIVVNRGGRPILGVKVSLVVDSLKTSIGSMNITGVSVLTDETGTFTLTKVPARYVYLRYTGDEILPGAYELRLDVDEQRIEVTQRCHFRIELLNPSSPAAQAYFQDAAGAPLWVSQFNANGMRSAPFATLQSGRSEVWSVSDLAKAVILKDDGGELSRHAIDLSSGEVNVLRL